MEFVTLNSGGRMPVVGFGTWQLRGWEGERAVLDALETGYRLLDTARMYQNEEMVGSALRQSGLPRREVFLTTKLQQSDGSYEKAREGIARSLEALKTDYVDLLLVHEPYAEAGEMYRACLEAQKAGLAKAVGISNFSREEYLSFLKACPSPPAVNQMESHVYHTNFALKQTLDACGTVMQGWAPFAEGRRPIFSEPVLVSIGRNHGKSAAQTALRYLVQRGIPVIPKSADPGRMAENLDIFDFTLTEEELAKIAALDGEGSLFGW